VVTFKVRVVLKEERQRVVDLDRRKMFASAVIEKSKELRELTRGNFLVPSRHDGVVKDNGHGTSRHWEPERLDFTPLTHGIIVLILARPGSIAANPGPPAKVPDARTRVHIYQCARSSASKLTIPETNDPAIATVASTPRGNPTFINEAKKIADIGSAMTK
jgi:hypothetical protein